jgi:hypothetical protein
MKKNMGILNYKNVFSIDDTKETKNVGVEFLEGHILNKNCKVPYNSPANVLINTSIEHCANRAYNYGGTHLAVTSKDPLKPQVDCAILNEDSLKQIQNNTNNTTILWEYTTVKSGHNKVRHVYFWFSPTGQIILKQENLKKKYRGKILSKFGNSNNKCDPFLGNRQINVVQSSYATNCRVCKDKKKVRVNPSNDIKNIIQDNILCQQAQSNYKKSKVSYNVNFDKFDNEIKKTYPAFDVDNKKYTTCDNPTDPEFKVSFTCDGGKNIINPFKLGDPTQLAAGLTTGSAVKTNNGSMSFKQDITHGDVLTFQCPKKDTCDGSPFIITLEDNGTLNITKHDKTNTYSYPSNKKGVVPPHVIEAIKYQRRDHFGPKTDNHILHIEHYLCKDPVIKSKLNKPKYVKHLSSGNTICENIVLLSKNHICCATFYDYTIRVHCILVKTLPIANQHNKLTGIIDPQETSVAIYKLNKTKDISDMGHVGYNTNNDVKEYPENMLSYVCNNSDPYSCWIKLNNHIISPTTDSTKIHDYVDTIKNENNLDFKNQYLNDNLPGILRYSDLFKDGSKVVPAIFDLTKCNLPDVFRAASLSPECHIISIDNKKKKLYALNKNYSTYDTPLSASKLFFTNENIPKYPTLLFKNRGCGTVYVKKPIINSKSCKTAPIHPISLVEYSKFNKSDTPVSSSTKCGTNPDIDKANCLYNNAKENLDKTNNYYKSTAKKICKQNEKLKRDNAAILQQNKEKKQQLKKLHNIQKQKGIIPKPPTHNKEKQKPTYNTHKNLRSESETVVHNPTTKDHLTQSKEKIDKGVDLTMEAWLANMQTNINKRNMFFTIYTLFGISILFILIRMYRRNN